MKHALINVDQTQINKYTNKWLKIKLSIKKLLSFDGVRAGSSSCCCS